MKLKIFQHEQQGRIVILTPVGDGSGFRYQELHLDVNNIPAETAKPGITPCREPRTDGILRLGVYWWPGLDAAGEKNRGGLACFSAATPQMMNVLKNMSLFRLWPYFTEEGSDRSRAGQRGGRSRRPPCPTHSRLPYSLFPFPLFLCSPSGAPTGHHNR